MRVEFKCDCCNDPVIKWTYKCTPFSVDQSGSPFEFSGTWAVCDPCHLLIDAGDISGLARRATDLETIPMAKSSIYDMSFKYFTGFMANRLGPAEPLVKPSQVDRKIRISSGGGMHSAEEAVNKVRTLIAGLAKTQPWIWQEMDKALALRNTIRPDLRDLFWPNWCYMPTETFVHANPVHIEDQRLRTGWYPEITTLSAWRGTQGVYQFDEALFNALWNTPVTGDIPVGVLTRLPEYATMVMLPKGKFLGVVPDAGEVLCALCIMNYTCWIPALTVLLVRDDMEEHQSCIIPSIYHITFPLGRRTVEENFALIAEGFRGADDTDGIALKLVEEHADELAGLMSVLMYLCSEEPDMTGRFPRRAVGTSIKKHSAPRYIPPNSSTVVPVGLRIGSALRHHEAHSSRGEHRGGTVRAHIRRAHWHTWWTGPKSSQQVPKVKWLPPIPVNVPEGHLEAVIRPVDALSKRT